MTASMFPQVGASINEIRESLEKERNKWMSVPLRLAVTGTSGSGKSSLINALLGYEPDSSHAARTGCVETTVTVKEYKDQQNPNLVYVDLPGVGTENFPRAKYLEDINFEKFDFFILVTAERFREDDMWLANEIKRRNKRYLFVRTKIDTDIKNDRRRRGVKKETAENKATAVKTVMSAIRSDIEANLGNQYEDSNVFLINNWNPRKLDFPKLTSTILERYPEEKREAMILSMKLYGKEALQQKFYALKARISHCAMMSALGGLSPIPGTSLAADLMIIAKEVEFYICQLGIDGNSLARMAKFNDKTLARLRMIVLSTIGIDGTASINKDNLQVIFGMLGRGLTAEIASSAIEESMKTIQWLFPLAGTLICSIAGAGLSYYTTSLILNKILELMHKCALEVMASMIEGEAPTN